MRILRRLLALQLVLATMLVVFGSMASAGEVPWVNPSPTALVPETVVHRSAVLNQDQTFLIFKPANFDPAKRYPVLYLLNGGGDYVNFGNCKDWYRFSNLADYLRNHDMYVVLPDNKLSYIWFDDPTKPERRYESYIINELIPYVDAHYNTLPLRNFRAISGYSGGGFGVVLAARHGDVFGVATSILGGLAADDFLPKELRAEFNLLEIVKAGKFPGGLKVFLLNDFPRSGYTVFTRDIHAEMEKMKIMHWYMEIPSGHSWELADMYLQEHLLFVSRRFNTNYKVWLRDQQNK